MNIEHVRSVETTHFIGDSKMLKQTLSIALAGIFAFGFAAPAAAASNTPSPTAWAAQPDTPPSPYDPNDRNKPPQP